MKGGGKPRQLVGALGAGAGLAALAAGLVFGGSPAMRAPRRHEPDDPKLLRRRMPAWRLGNNRKYAAGRYKGSAAAKRATKLGGNHAAHR